MRRVSMVRVLLMAVCCCTLAPIWAQSINIDIGVPGTEPPSSYRAAGIPGHWQKFEATTWGLYYDLVDINGNPTGARVRQIGGTELVTTGGQGLPEGSDSILLRDALITHAVENCLFFVGLQPGTYEVLTYAWMPTAPTTLNHVWIDFHPVEPMIGGNYPGQLTEGVTHARHEFVTFDGVINMHSGIPSGNGPNPGAALNGVQVRLMTPEPPLFVDPGDLNWLGAVDSARYDVVHGDLGTLRATDGDFFAATNSCLANNLPALGLPHAGAPAPGQGEWFLVRGISGANANTWNAPGTTQVQDRDLEINAAAATCP